MRNDGLSGHAAERAGIDRRKFLLAATGAVGALVAACDSQGPASAGRLLKFAEQSNEGIERVLYRPSSRDVPFETAKAAGQRFPAYFISDTVPVWDAAARGVWR